MPTIAQLHHQSHLKLFKASHFSNGDSSWALVEYLF
jgi:hypothetical protein